MTLRQSVFLPRILLCVWLLDQFIVVVLAERYPFFAVLSFVSSVVILLASYRSREWIGAHLFCEAGRTFVLETQHGARYLLNPDSVFLFHPVCVMLRFNARYCVILPDMLSKREYSTLRYRLGVMGTKKR